jgi:hypothetical protein
MRERTFRAMKWTGERASTLVLGFWAGSVCMIRGKVVNAATTAPEVGSADEFGPQARLTLRDERGKTLRLRPGDYLAREGEEWAVLRLNP